MAKIRYTVAWQFQPEDKARELVRGIAEYDPGLYEWHGAVDTADTERLVLVVNRLLDLARHHGAYVFGVEPLTSTETAGQDAAHIPGTPQAP